MLVRLAAKAATTTIPIVFAVGEDPVKLGLVASLARPGGNADRHQFFQRLSCGKAAGAPARAGARGRSRGRAGQSGQCSARRGHAARHAEAAARALGLQIQVLNASTSREIDAAFATLVRERPDALFVGPDAFFNSRRVQLATLAARHAVPATYALREFVEAGGLMSYGTDLLDA